MTGNGVKVDPEKFTAIAKWEEQINVSTVRPFLGLENFYREFIPNFYNICKLLNNLTKKGPVWEWSHHQKSAFQHLKKLLLSSPILMMLNPDADTILEADSSGYAIGGVVSQTDEKGRIRPIGLFSRKLSLAEANYEIYDKELLAIIATIKHFRSELRNFSKPFIVLSDHRNLQYFMLNRLLSERQVCLAEELTSFIFEIKFRPGIESGKPDILSRKFELQPKNANDERLKKREFQILKDRWISPSNLNNASTLHLAAMVTRSQICSFKPQEKLPPIDSHKKTVSSPISNASPKGNKLFNDASIQNLWDAGIKNDSNFHNIYCSVKNGESSLPPLVGNLIQMPNFCLDSQKALFYRRALCVPDWEALFTALIQRVYDSHVTGHPGREITLATLAQNFFWPQQYKEARRFVRNCHYCGGSKFWRQSIQGLLLPLPVPERIHSELSIDFMTDFPLTDNNENF